MAGSQASELVDRLLDRLVIRFGRPNHQPLSARVRRNDRLGDELHQNILNSIRVRFSNVITLNITASGFTVDLGDGFLELLVIELFAGRQDLLRRWVNRQLHLGDMGLQQLNDDGRIQCL